MGHRPASESTMIGTRIAGRDVCRTLRHAQRCQPERRAVFRDCSRGVILSEARLGPREGGGKRSEGSAFSANPLSCQLRIPLFTQVFPGRVPGFDQRDLLLPAIHPLISFSRWIATLTSAGKRLKPDETVAVVPRAVRSGMCLLLVLEDAPAADRRSHQRRGFCSCWR